jgi:hypothetical protein
MPRTVVGRSSLIAAVGALLCLAAAPAEAGCSKSVVMYNAFWCPYCRLVRAILARHHIRYRSSTRPPRKSKRSWSGGLATRRSHGP